MKFKKSEPSINFPEMEKSILKFWEKNNIFERSVSEKSEKDIFSFYDGPPFATGLPHYGHLLAGTIKDVVPRYWAMRGRKVKRRFGWDCHGLPVEFEMEKELNLKGRKDILNFGVGKFNEACRSIVLRYTQEWETTVKRMGRWIDFKNDYKTMDVDFMESVWAVFKKLWDQGLIYEDKKVLPYSTRVASPLSNFEANLNYQTVQDPSVYVKFKLKNEPNTYLLIWTTTPWTLPANLAIAVNPKFTYVKFKLKTSEEILIIEQTLLEDVRKKSKSEGDILETLLGSQLKGLAYEQLIPAFEGKIPVNAHQVVLGDFVTSESGTGLVHMAPAFGEDDFLICKQHGLSPLDHLDEEGNVTSDVQRFQGLYFKDADKKIIIYLKEKNALFLNLTYEHSYPFCYRSDTPLIYRAISTWFVRVEKIKADLIENNAQVHWVPEHLKEGRFGKWLEGAKDWAISRNRFWGNPLPIWKNEDTGEMLCVGSKKELELLTGKTLNDLHKHFIDDLEIVSPKTGAILKRIPHVLDCWFESGAMPYAQNHYPFSMSEKEFDAIFPADFIAEGLDQTRGWFYTLSVLSAAMGKGPAFKNVVVNGIVLAEDGRKMSKRLKNYPDPAHVLEELGADTLRMYLLQSPAVRGDDLRFSEQGLKESTRRLLLPMWNTFSFLSTYAHVDQWDPQTQFVPSSHELDVWIRIKLERLKAEIKKEMELYHLSKAVAPIPLFLDELNNWYVRRSRRRFWKSENDQDKLAAFSTLYEVFVELVKLCAPFMPFLSEFFYQALKLGHPLAQKDSVHLDQYPEPNQTLNIQDSDERPMDLALKASMLGRELREKIKIKTRQPLQKLFVGLVKSTDLTNLQKTQMILQEELNVKEIEFRPFDEFAQWNPKPNFKTLGKKLGGRMKDFQAFSATLSKSHIETLLKGESFHWEGFEISPEDIAIALVPKKDFQFTCHAHTDMVVAFDETLSPELVREGIAREVVSTVQKLRKDMDLVVSDRIQLHLSTTEASVLEAIGQFQTYVETETLSNLYFEKPAEHQTQFEELFDKTKVTIGISKI